MPQSPLTGVQVQIEVKNYKVPLHFVGDQGTIGDWAMSGSVKDAGFIRNSKSYDYRGRFKLEGAALQQVFAVAASRVYLEKKQGKIAMILSQTELDDVRLDGWFTKGNWERYTPYTVEEIWREARDLLFEVKALLTLHNIVNAEQEVAAGVKVWDLIARTYDTGQHLSADKLPEGIFPGGFFYGAVQHEANTIAVYLMERGYINCMNSSQISVRPAGYIANDEIRMGLSGIRKAFLICAFDDQGKRIHDEVYRPVGDDPEVNCPIQRTIDIEFVEPIDDRIVLEISESSIIIVDLSHLDNFNVAFEAGYAAALGKPVVWTRAEADPAKLKLPFDIHSENFLLYDPDNLPDFKDRLKYRVLAALNKSTEGKLPLHRVRDLVQKFKTA